MTILDLDTLALVCGGTSNDEQLAQVQAMTAQSQGCQQLLSSLHLGNQHVPTGFKAACGELHPNIQEGRPVSRNFSTQRLETR